jgi:Uma2 family endonuclease
MTALLELPAVRERVRGVSVDGYHRLGELGLLCEDVELLRGIIVAKMSKSPLHELVAQKLLKLLLARVPAGFEVRPERPITLADSELEPDLSVVRGRPDDWVSHHPATAALGVEIAITSTAIDESKAEIYAEGGIPEYWLVRPEHREADIYSQPEGSGYSLKRTLKAKDTVRCGSLPGVEFRLAEVLPLPV